MDTILARAIAKKLAANLKRRLAARLPWLAKYETIPTGSNTQEEEDENALNEALEAKMMQLIAESSDNVDDRDGQDNVFKISCEGMPTYQTGCQRSEPQTCGA